MGREGEKGRGSITLQARSVHGVEGIDEGLQVVAQGVIEPVLGDPGRVAADGGMFFHSEKRVARCFTNGSSACCCYTLRGKAPTVNLKASIGVEIRIGPGSEV